MKNTYIIAIKEGFEPVFIQVKPLNCIAYIWKHYKHAYIMENKKKATETFLQRYKQREERKKDENYKNLYF